MNIIYTIPSIPPIQMRPMHRRTIVVRPTTRHAPHAIRSLPLLRPRHAIMRPVKPQLGNPGVPLDARRLLQPRGQIPADLAEDGDLALDDLGLRDGRHVARDVGDEALPGCGVEDVLPELAGRVEVFGPDLGQECHGVADELAVQLVEVDGALAEADGGDGAEVVGAGTLVAEGHGAVALEITHAVGDARLVDGQLLVVDADAVAVRVGVGEESAL